MEKVWLKSYPLGIASEIAPDAYSSLTTMLEESCQTFADLIAFENYGTTLSYQDLLKKSIILAAYFQKHLHLDKGDRIAIMLPNTLQYPIALLAALQLGLIIVNTNPLYTERELRLQLQDSGAKAIIVLANFVPNLLAILHETQVKHVIITELGDEFRPFKRIAFNSYLKYIKRIVPRVELSNCVSYREAMAIGSSLSFDKVILEPPDIAFLQYTGGTTGVPKGAMLTHRNIVANVIQCLAWINHLLEKGKETVVVALPLYHIFSLTICCFAFWKLGGRSLLITNPRQVGPFIKEIKKTPCSVFVGVNTLYQALLNHPSFDTVDWSALKLSLAGGMAVTETVAKKWQQTTGKPIIMGYGLTEASPVVTINPLRASEFNGSIGLPLPSTDVRVVNDQDVDVGIGAVGELVVSGPQVMLGYWHQSQETQQVLTATGWLKTGDIVKIDEAGYIYLIDRKKDMILVSGFNVYPNEVEDVIAKHPGVAEVAVVGVPNASSGESVKAFIVRKDHNLSEEEIRLYCKQTLTGYKQPKMIEFCHELPKSNVGKILRNKLRNNP